MLAAFTALYSLAAGVNVAQNAEQRGRSFELAVGAVLVQQPGQVFYWRERNDEVDFVYQYRDALYAIEVKSGRKKSARGLEVFCAQVPQALRPPHLAGRAPDIAVGDLDIPQPVVAFVTAAIDDACVNEFACLCSGQWHCSLEVGEFQDRLIGSPLCIPAMGCVQNGLSMTQNVSYITSV